VASVKLAANPPEWMNSNWLAINAKIPAGTTRADFRLMQQNPLKEPFHLALRRETKNAKV
jgi:uncharacterized protein (TIGR03435 family)